MYLDYYGLSEKPFDINTDPRFLWLGEKHKEAFSVLKYGVLENKGFLLLTGDVGAGKTTLIHALVESLGDDVIVASIPDPGLELMDFYRYLADAFHIDHSFSHKADFIFIFREFLHQANENNKTVLLIIDEAQRLSNELLEEIRLLSNIELHTKKLLNIFFVGQVEFNTKLLESANRSVRQRITVSNHIQPLTEKETGDYIRHRLMVAGCKKNVFSFVAIHGIHAFSGGYPRLINIICDLALLTGYVKEVNKIGEDIISECVESLNIESYKKTKPEPVSENKNHKKGMALPRDIVNEAWDEPEANQLVLKKSVWPKLATLYVVLLLVIIAVYILYSDRIMAYIKHMKSSPGVVVSEPASLADSVVSAPAAATPAKPEQKSLYPIIETPEGGDQHAEVIPEPAEDGGSLQKTDQVTEPSSDERDALPEKPLDTIVESDVIPGTGKIILDFKHNSNDFSDNDYAVLEKFARYMQSNPDVGALVIGYTDDMGSYSYNVNLSSFRANIVKSYLAGKGIDISRIRATGLGPEHPRASNSSPQGRRMNRRVEIEVVKKNAD